MKTTLNLEDGLLLAAKELAAERGVTLTSVVEDSLRAALKKPATNRGKEDFPAGWPVVKGTSVPDVDIADRDALHEYMEGRR